MSRADDFYGAGSVDRLFPDGAGSAQAPFPQAGRRKDVKEFDPDLVNKAVADPHYPLTPVDPRTLHKTQPALTRAGVQHYMSGQFSNTYADAHQAGNRHPVVYQRDGTNVILSGHHRAATALLKGESLHAKVVKGSWGPPRR